MRCLVMEMKLCLILLILAYITTNASSSEAGYMRCERTVKNWASSLDDSQVNHDKHTLGDLLFFLHIPRTGGRTYFHCFLKKLYSNSQECPRSYDKIRFDPRKQNCHLLSTHDDYSIMHKLPEEKTSVMTILRNPIDRIFSTYEFSIEVAARFLIHPNLTSVAKMTKRLRKKSVGVSTLDIWPWKYLVPWMREDLFARRDARKLTSLSYTSTDSPYDMEEIVMPLHEYINDPIVQDIVHNGATFQIAGLTNNSYTRESHEVRHCLLKYQNLGKYVLEVAKKRLDNMLYVGLTEKHKESATMFANVVGAQVISQFSNLSSITSSAHNNGTEESSSHLNSKPDVNDHQADDSNQREKKVSSTAEDKYVSENMTVSKLMEAYESCIKSLRKTQAERGIKSFKQIAPANFTKEARTRIPESLLEEIMSLNSLDMELYSYAQDIFAKKQALMEHNVDHEVMLSSTFSASTLDYSYGLPSWEVLSLAIISLLLLCIFLFVKARRRTSKYKL